jgi:hypothetical protein
VQGRSLPASLNDGAPALAAPSSNLRPCPPSRPPPVRQTEIFTGASGAPLNFTLEGALLARWASGAPRFDALHLQGLPSPSELVAGNASWGYTLLVNQSAVAALPAALAAANTAALRLVAAARSGGGSGGSRGRTAAEPAAARARLEPPSQLPLESGAGRRGGSGGAAGDAQPTIRVLNRPLPLQRGEAAMAVRQDAAALMLVLCVVLAGSVLSASFVVHLAR